MKLSLTPALGFSAAPPSVQPEAAATTLLRSRPKGPRPSLAKAVVRPVSVPLAESNVA